MGGKISDNTDVFENILTKQWRKNPHPKRVRILTHLLMGNEYIIYFMIVLLLLVITIKK